jgi:Domain of unknown function DUF11/von Willebrand factor type A domain/WD40-like Beta Propeller Repeat
VVVHARREASLVAVTALLAGSLLIEGSIAVGQEPPPQPLAPYRVGYVSEDSPQPAPDEPGTDVWSADARGQNREDATNLPGVDETDPAYSPDGTRLAYTQYDPEAPSYVVVAGSDGSDPRRLTAPDPNFAQRDPAWSPDGTMIALTRDAGEGPASVQIVRVADGLIVGEVPIPAHLIASDRQPAWSPDGTRIALTRYVSRQRAPKVDPFQPSAAAPAGTSLPLTATAHTPLVPAEPQIVFLLDTTGSMGGVLQTVKDRLRDVMQAVTGDQPHAEFGLATYRDIDDGGERFRLRHNLTTDITAIQTELNTLQAGGGGDAGEDWLNALNQLTVEPVFTRPNTTRIVVLVGDAWSHEECAEPPISPEPPRPGSAEPTKPGKPPEPCASRSGYLRRDAVVEALQRLGIRVVAVPVLPPHPDIDSPGLDKYGQARDVATRTDGTILPTDSPPDQVTEAILAGISHLRVTVTPEAACDAGLTMTFDPPSITVPGNTDVQFAETVLVSGDAPVGARLRCTVTFRLSGPPVSSDPLVQHVSLTVAERRLPRVVVEGRAVPSTGSTGAVVEYRASAVAADGRLLDPTCAPSSGSQFPIGTTIVRCTATDTDGNVGTASATMTVFEPVQDGSTTLWLIGLSSSTPDGVTITDQTNLSVKIGEPCAGGSDSAPDWSPDGQSLVFQHSGDTICVVDADGSGARQPIEDCLCIVASDPAWSPDGAVIAFGVGGDEGERASVWTVPAGGGRADVLVDTAGGAFQPAFQRLIDLGVVGSAVPPSIPFNGTATLEFVLTNRGLATASNTEAVVQLPAALRPEEISATKGSCALSTLRCTVGLLAPGEIATIRLVVTGVGPGDQIARITVTADSREANPPDNQASVTVAVGQPPAPTGSLSVAVTMSPGIGYVGGDDVVVTFTVRNGTNGPVIAVRLTAVLPAALQPISIVAPVECRADGSVCELGALQPGQSIEVRFILPARAAIDTTVSGTVTGDGADQDPNDNTASGRLVIHQPVLTVAPLIGRPGLVVRALGSDFPPGARVRLSWSVGLSETPGEVTVRADGRMDAQVLIFHNDQLGLRELTAAPVSGQRFGVTRSAPLLVVPRALQPPSFQARR